MTDQFITDKRAELTNLSAEYKQLADQLVLIRDNFTAKTIKEMIDAGIVYLTCDHKTVSTLNETDPYSHLATKCENCHAELNKVGEYFLNKNEKETLYRIKQQRGAGIYTDHMPSSKPPVTAILKKRERLAIDYKEIQMEIVNHIIDKLHKNGMIHSCRHQTPKEGWICKICDKGVTWFGFGEQIALTHDDKHLFDDVTAKISEIRQYSNIGDLD